MAAIANDTQLIGRRLTLASTAVCTIRVRFRALGAWPPLGVVAVLGSLTAALGCPGALQRRHTDLKNAGRWPNKF